MGWVELVPVIKGAHAHRHLDIRHDVVLQPLFLGLNESEAVKYRQTSG